jgi:hypothetical protein
VIPKDSFRRKYWQFTETVVIESLNKGLCKPDEKIFANWSARYV